MSSPAPMERAQSNRHRRALANFAMRHQKKTIKLGRTAEHRKALLANQVCSLIEHQRIRTTLAKAKAVRPLAEKMVTLGKNGSIHARRTAFATLRQKDAVKKLFDEIAPASTERNGGYTRIIRLGQRQSDSASMALIEWVDATIVIEEKPAEDKKAKKEKAPTAETKAEAKPKETKREEAKVEEKVTEEPKKKRRWFGRKQVDEK